MNIFSSFTDDSIDFQGMPGFLLRRCQQISVAIFLDECRELALTPLQFAVLAALRQAGSMDQATLGGVAALDRTTIRVVLEKLEERGVIQRCQSNKDKRSMIVSITEAGLKLLAQSKPHVQRVQDRILSPLTAKERETLVDLLNKMAETNNNASRAPRRIRR